MRCKDNHTLDIYIKKTFFSKFIFFFKNITYLCPEFLI